MRCTWTWCLVALAGIALAAPRTALQAQEARKVWIGERQPVEGQPDRVAVAVEIDDISSVYTVDMVVDLELVFDGSAVTIVGVDTLEQGGDSRFLLTGNANGNTLNLFVEVRRTALLRGSFITNIVDGKLLVASAGTRPNQGSGAFLEVVTEAGDVTVDLEIDEILFNDGRIPVEVTSGPAPSGGDDSSTGGGGSSTGGGGSSTGGGGDSSTGGGDSSTGGGDPPPTGEAPAPSSFAARVGLETAVLSWSPSASDQLASYTLYRQAVNGAFTPVASGLTGTSHVDQGLLLGVPYTYYVKAVDQAGVESDPSPRAGGVPALENVPGAPTPVGSQVVDGKAVLTVGNARPADPDDALTYTFEVSASELFDAAVDRGEGIVQGDGATRWTVSETLAPAQVYWWRARASDPFFAGPWSEPAFLVGPLVDPGDLDGDGRVYIDDFFLFANAFGTAWGQAGYETIMDLSGDGRVEWDDFYLFADLFGAVYR